MRLGWKVFIPVTLGWLVVVGLAVLYPPLWAWLSAVGVVTVVAVGVRVLFHGVGRPREVHGL
jgi:ABC-type Na+ efflux pump permease subunit